jgi:hypothetical protein
MLWRCGTPPDVHHLDADPRLDERADDFGPRERIEAGAEQDDVRAEIDEDGEVSGFERLERRCGPVGDDPMRQDDEAALEPRAVDGDEARPVAGDGVPRGACGGMQLQ